MLSLKRRQKWSIISVYMTCAKYVSKHCIHSYLEELFMYQKVPKTSAN